MAAAAKVKAAKEDAAAVEAPAATPFKGASEVGKVIKVGLRRGRISTFTVQFPFELSGQRGKHKDRLTIYHREDGIHKRSRCDDWEDVGKMWDVAEPLAAESRAEPRAEPRARAVKFQSAAAEVCDAPKTPQLEVSRGHSPDEAQEPSPARRTERTPLAPLAVGATQANASASTCTSTGRSEPAIRLGQQLRKRFVGFGRRLWHGEVVEVHSDKCTVRWDDGSSSVMATAAALKCAAAALERISASKQGTTTAETAAAGDSDAESSGESAAEDYYV
eukprot:g598.t1